MLDVPDNRWHELHCVFRGRVAHQLLFVHLWRLLAVCRYEHDQQSVLCGYFDVHAEQHDQHIADHVQRDNKRDQRLQPMHLLHVKRFVGLLGQ
jgi:hypothetical protein